MIPATAAAAFMPVLEAFEASGPRCFCKKCGHFVSLPSVVLPRPTTQRFFMAITAMHLYRVATLLYASPGSALGTIPITVPGLTCHTPHKLKGYAQVTLAFKSTNSHTHRKANKDNHDQSWRPLTRSLARHTYPSPPHTQHCKAGGASCA